MGRRPAARHTIERRDNSLGYGPQNCYWATYTQNLRNTRRNRLVTFSGETLLLSAWVERTGISYAALFYRLYRLGWLIEKALTAPTRQQRKHTNQ